SLVHGEDKFADAFTRTATYQGRAQNALGPCVHMNARKAFCLAIKNRAVKVGKRQRESFGLGTALPGLLFGEPHMGNLGVGVRCPGNDQAARLLPSEEKRIL